MEIKSPRVRSVAYPSLSLFECIDLTSQIYKIFGSATYTSRDVIAKQLGVSESHLQTQISSCVQFGLLELKSKEGYRPTDLYIIVRNPLPDESVSDAYVQLINNPPLYKAIIEQFNKDQLPQEAGLATILFRKHKVAEKVSLFAARVFIQSIIQCNFLDQENWILDIVEPRRANDFVEVIEDKKKDQIIYLPTKAESVKKIEEADTEPIEILLDNGRKATVLMPKDYTKRDLERVVKIVGIYME